MSKVSKKRTIPNPIGKLLVKSVKWLMGLMILKRIKTACPDRKFELAILAVDYGVPQEDRILAVIGITFKE